MGEDFLQDSRLGGKSALAIPWAKIFYRMTGWGAKVRWLGWLGSRAGWSGWLAGVVLVVVETKTEAANKNNAKQIE